MLCLAINLLRIVLPVRTVPEKIRDFLCDRMGRPYSDSCAQEQLGLRWPPQVQVIMATLAVTGHFVRTPGICSSCNQEKHAEGQGEAMMKRRRRTIAEDLLIAIVIATVVVTFTGLLISFLEFYDRRRQQTAARGCMASTRG